MNFTTPQSKEFITVPPTTVCRTPLLPLCTDYRALNYIQDSLNHLVQIVQSKQENHPHSVEKMNMALQKLADSSERREAYWQQKYRSLQQQERGQRANLQGQIERLRKELRTREEELQVLRNGKDSYFNIKQMSSANQFQQKLKEQQTVRKDLENKLLLQAETINTLRKEFKDRKPLSEVEADIEDDLSLNSLNIQREMQNRLNQALRNVEILQRQRNELQQKYEQRRKAGVFDQIKINQMRGKLQSIQSRYREYERSLTTLQQEKHRQRQEKQAEKQRRLQIDRQFKNYRQKTEEKLQKYKEKETALNQTLRDLKSEFKTLQSDFNTKLKAKKADFQSLEAAKRKLEKELQKQMQKQAMLMSREEQLTRQLKSAVQTARSNQQRQKQSWMSELNSKANQLARRNKELDKANADLQYQCQDLKLENFKLLQKLQIKEKEIKKLTARVTESCSNFKYQERSDLQFRLSEKIIQLEKANLELSQQNSFMKEQQNFSFSEGLKEQADRNFQTEPLDFQNRCSQLQTQVQSLKGTLDWYSSQYQRLQRSNEQPDSEAQLKSTRRAAEQSVGQFQ